MDNPENGIFAALPPPPLNHDPGLRCALAIKGGGDRNPVEDRPPLIFLRRINSGFHNGILSDRAEKGHFAKEKT